MSMTEMSKLFTFAGGQLLVLICFEEKNTNDRVIQNSVSDDCRGMFVVTLIYFVQQARRMASMANELGRGESQSILLYATPDVYSSREVGVIATYEHVTVSIRVGVAQRGKNATSRSRWRQDGWICISRTRFEGAEELTWKLVVGSAN